MREFQFSYSLKNLKDDDFKTQFTKLHADWVDGDPHDTNSVEFFLPTYSVQGYHI